MLNTRNASWYNNYKSLQISSHVRLLKISPTHTADADLSTSKQLQPYDPSQLKDFPFRDPHANMEPTFMRAQNALFIRACTYTTFKVHVCL